MLAALSEHKVLVSKDVENRNAGFTEKRDTKEVYN